MAQRDLTNLSKPLYGDKGLTEKQIIIRERVMQDFEAFIKLFAPFINLAGFHIDMINFLMNGDDSNKLLLLPRGHSKSSIVSIYVLWRLVKNPCLTVLYASSTSTLAEASLSYIKNIMTSDIFFKYFQGLIEPEQGKREKWAVNEIKVDHPIRKERGIRDASISAVGAGKNITGLHFDLLVLDDIVAPNTEFDPLTDIGRKKAELWYSFSNSILNPDGETIVAGTRYHEKDLYSLLIDMEKPVFDDNGNIKNSRKVYNILEREVETDGQFLWPRQKTKDGRWVGYNDEILAEIKSKYIDVSQFYAQYYNKIISPENQIIKREDFQYYDRNRLTYIFNHWRFNDRPLTIYSALDIAVSTEKRADYTALVVVGVDELGYRYVLDCQRIKTDRISEIAYLLFEGYSKWRWLKLSCETNSQQGIIAKQLQDLLRQKNAIFSWNLEKHWKNKFERIKAVLEPLYSQKIIFHYKGGNCEILEDEILSLGKGHDDLVDALSCALDLIKFIPKRQTKKVAEIKYHPRFGGVL